MNIKSPNDLKIAIDLAIKGDVGILYDIARYISYNYYMYMHIKKDSPEDLENEIIYKSFEENYPVLHKDVELLIDGIYQKD